MNNDLISREALKKALSSKDLITWTHEYGDAIPIEWIMSTIDNAPTVEAYTPEQVKELVDLNKKLSEARPQGEWIENKVIVETLREMLSNLCMGCSGCDDKCLDYRVLEYLLEEKEGDLSGK